MSYVWLDEWQPPDGKPRPWEYVFADVESGTTYNQWGEQLDSVGNVAMGSWPTKPRPAPQAIRFPTVDPYRMDVELWRPAAQGQVMMAYPQGWRA